MKILFFGSACIIAPVNHPEVLNFAGTNEQFSNIDAFFSYCQNLLQEKINSHYVSLYISGFNFDGSSLVNRAESTGKTWNKPLYSLQLIPDLTPYCFGKMQGAEFLFLTEAQIINLINNQEYYDTYYHPDVIKHHPIIIPIFKAYQQNYGVKIHKAHFRELIEESNFLATRLVELRDEYTNYSNSFYFALSNLEQRNCLEPIDWLAQYPL